MHLRKMQGPRKLLIWLFTELSQPVVRPNYQPFGVLFVRLECHFLSQWKVSHLRVIQFTINTAKVDRKQLPTEKLETLSNTTR